MLVQIHLRAAKLDNISPSAWRRKKSNPYAKVLLLSPDKTNGSSIGNNILGHTEVIYNNLSPIWSTILTVEHDEIAAWTPLRISIHDSRSTPSNEGRMKTSNNESSVLPRAVLQATPMEDDGKMGEIDLEVGDVLSTSGACEREFKLNEGGSLFVHITPSIRNSTKSTLANGLFTAQFRGLDFKNIESGILGLGAIDPYFELSKRYHDPSTGNIRWQLVYRSEYIHNIINPYWDAFQLDLEKLCHGELRRELKITVYDYEKKSAHRKLGEAEVTVEELMASVTRGGNASREHSLRILDKKGYVVGLIVVLKADIARVVEDECLGSVATGSQEGIEYQLHGR